MSEQQFTIESERINTTYSVRILKDDEVIFEISNWNSLGEMHKTECEDIVALLNEQQATINKLKERNAHNFAKKMQLQKEIKELKEENEQLKARLKQTGKLNKRNSRQRKTKLRPEPIKMEKGGDGMVEYSIEDFFRWLQRIKKEFEDFEDNGD